MRRITWTAYSAPVPRLRTLYTVVIMVGSHRTRARVFAATTLLVCAASSFVPRLGSAQSAPAGSVDLQGRVLLKVFVTMVESGTFGHPIAAVKLFAVSSGDRLALETDPAGVASAWLPPGNYHLDVPDPVIWRGRAYTWDVPVAVRPGMNAVDLTQGNASTTAAGPAGDEGPGASTSGAASSARRPAEDAFRKDPATAVILSFFIPGVGQMYAGEGGKGAALLGVHILSYAAVVYGVDCYNNYTCSRNTANTYIGVGAGVILGNWIYSMVDAAGAAHRHNQQAGFLSALEHPEPMVAAGAQGSTRIGLVVHLAP